MSDRLSRRRLLAISVATVAAGLSGCTDDGNVDGTSDDDSGNGASGDRRDDADSSTNDNDADGSDEDGTGPSDDTGHASSYVLEIDLHEAGAPEISQTYHEGDRYTRTEFGNGEVIESYYVNGTSYGVVGGNCIITNDPAAENSVPDIEDPQGIQDRLERTETTTLDGDSVEVYEIPDEDARWYVSTETGYPVKLETEAATVTFHSWGETDPIEAPDGECTET